MTRSKRAVPTPERRTAEWRQAFLEALTPTDVRQIVGALVAKAKTGNAAAARVVLARALGVRQVEHWQSFGEYLEEVAEEEAE